MVLNNNFSLNLTLNVISILFLGMLIVFVMIKKIENKRFNALGTASQIVLFGNFMELISQQQMMMNGKFSAVSAVTLALSYVLFGGAYIALFFFSFSKDDGKLNPKLFKMKKNIIDYNYISWPILINILLHIFVQDISVLGIGMTVAVYMAFFCYRLDKDEELVIKEKTIRDEKGMLLAEQIHPHFVFNSLMAIEELCYRDGELAAKSIENFAGYLRYNIDALSDSGLISFEKELKNINQYIELEKAASSKDFQVVYDLKETDFMIPVLSIQPLVENAIRHGIAKNLNERIVEISTEKKGEFILITVFDNGQEEVEITSFTEGKISVGFENVRRRIEENYHGTLKIRHNNQGTRAVVTIPLIEM